MQRSGRSSDLMPGVATAQGRGGGVLRVVEGKLVEYRRTWRASAFSTFVNPVLFLAAMGVGLGSLVDGDQQLGGLSYLAFYASGLLAAQSMQTAAGDSSFPVMAGLKWTKTYHSALATPLSSSDLVFGHLAFVVLRLLAAGVAFALAAALFGAFPLVLGLAAIPVVALCGLAYAAPVMAFTAALKRDTALAGLFRFGIVPMFLLSGTFFPIDQMPQWLQRVAQAIPLWHAIELVRRITLGVPMTWTWTWNVAYLAVWAAVGTAVALRMFRRRLVP